MKDMERLLYLGGPHRGLSLILLNLRENRYGTRKGIKFWIERLIVHLAEELSFRGVRFHDF